LRITALAGGVLAGGTFLGGRLAAGLYSLKETRSLMGTTLHLTVISSDEDQARLALESTFTEMERQVLLFNHRDGASPLFALNRDGHLANPPAELVAVLERARQISEQSAGAFDVTVKPVVDARYQSVDFDPNLLDLVDYRKLAIGAGELRFARAGMQATLDGIAKGTVVDGGLTALKAAGFPDVLVEAGGDLMVNGHSLSDQGWKIGISHPRPELLAGTMAAFTLQSGAAATSGDYYHALTADRTQHHIVDPRVGLSPTELASVTVLAEDATTADGLATAIMVMGARDGLALANALDGVEALTITKDLKVQRTSGFPGLS
jgi:thiamine biosynthesis lipoprotein